MDDIEKPPTPAQPESLEPTDEKPLVQPETPQSLEPTKSPWNKSEVSLILSIIAIALAILGIVLALLPHGDEQKHEHNEMAQVESVPHQPTAHNGHLLPLGYKSKICAEIIVSKDNLYAYIVDTKNTNLHPLVDKISICTHKIENNTVKGVVLEARKTGEYFCFDIDPTLLLPSEDFNTESRLRVFIRDVPYYGTLLPCCLKKKD